MIKAAAPEAVESIGCLIGGLFPAPAWPLWLAGELGLGRAPDAATTARWPAAGPA